MVEQKLSLAIAVVLFLTYFCVLGFSLRTHRHLFRSSEDDVEETARQWSRGKAITILLIATAVVALLSEFLVGTIENVRDSVGLTELFVGVIVVAIVGNAAEHSTAVLMAMKNKMDLTIGIAIGSSLQIALFVAPVLIFLSYVFGRPMDLEFTVPEVLAVVASVYILFQISEDGETNWIEGVQLLSVYLILGILFFYLPEPQRVAP
jgi:Ca2+:H+ antiporter